MRKAPARPDQAFWRAACLLQSVELPLATTTTTTFTVSVTLAATCTIDSAERR